MKIAIIGGGMAGLGAAHEFAKCNENDITLYEKSHGLGGLAYCVDVGGEPLEAFYHHMFPTYYDFFEIAYEIGVKEKMFFKSAKTGIFYKDELYPFDNPLDLLRFTPLSFTERLRAGLQILRLKKTKNWKQFENITAERWLQQAFGSRVYDVLWRPLLRGKFGYEASNISMTWVWGRIYERPSKFGYFSDGFKTIIDALEAHLKKKGVAIKTGIAVRNIRKEDARFFVEAEAGEVEYFDHIIVAAPPVPFSKIAAPLLPKRYAEKLKALKYFGTVCGIVLLERSLMPYYWLNINEEGSSLLAVVEQSNFVDAAAYGGLRPVYLAKYLDPESDFYKLSDREIWNAWLPRLAGINPRFRSGWVKEKYLFRAPFTQPIIPCGYSRMRPAFKTPVPNLWWVSMSHIYPWDRGTDHSFHAGRELARQVTSAP